MSGQHTQAVASTHANTKVGLTAESLTPEYPSQVMVNNYVDDLKMREADVLWNLEGTYSRRPDSFPGGYNTFLETALGQYGAPPTVALSLAALEGGRDLQYCNVATTDGNVSCGKAPGLYGSDVTSQQVQDQWTYPYQQWDENCPKGAKH